MTDILVSREMLEELRIEFDSYCIPSAKHYADKLRALIDGPGVGAVEPHGWAFENGKHRGFEFGKRRPDERASWKPLYLAAPVPAVPDVEPTALGAAVLVRGQVVAWFADFTEEAREWCTENHFGEWLTWRATPPKIVPLTKAEYDKAVKESAALAACFEALPEAPASKEKPLHVGTNTGHGHVWERPDGMKARCGGPVMCTACARDLAQITASKEKEE